MRRAQKGARGRTNLSTQAGDLDGALRVVAIMAQRQQVYDSLVALTGVEPAVRQFS